MKTETIKTILYTHFAGVASPLQTQLLREWLRSVENRELYYTWLQEWEQQHPQMITNAEDGYRSFQQKILTTPSSEIEVNANPPWLSLRKILIACCCTGIFLFTGYYLRIFWYEKVYQTAPSETKYITMPDGSHVKLHPKSRLSFNRIQSREVHLTGVAEFDVKNLSSGKKFIVYLPDNLSIEVLGTEFIVENNQKETDVRLITGKIRLGYQNDSSNKHFSMEPGDRIRYSHANKTLNKLNVANTIKQQEKEWVLSDITLQDLSLKIETTFQVKILIKNKQTAKMTLSGIVPTDNLDALLQSLALTLNLRIERKNDKIQIL